ncbi:hypothetical protein GDO81_005674 [Engystomops pustulosus]|uniref:Uncharacterized protein n=1 Tax=Engystomops pustulosus TaxID=76066 RepID=A0AAV7CQT2_ENGPU|nr:hypothetical protein GDO81_005674 [Engystomops pustulosus]
MVYVQRRKYVETLVQLVWRHYLRAKALTTCSVLEIQTVRWLRSTLFPGQFYMMQGAATKSLDISTLHHDTWTQSLCALSYLQYVHKPLKGH